jgi:hypothetical protein
MSDIVTKDFVTKADNIATKAIRDIRNEERRFRLEIEDANFIFIGGKLKKLFGDYKKSKTPNQYEMVKEGAVITSFLGILNASRLEFEREIQQEIEQELANLDKGDFGGGALVGGVAGTAAGLSAGLLTQTVTTTAPLWGIPLLAKIGLVTTTTVDVALLGPLAATGVGAVAAVAIASGIQYYTGNKSRKAALAALSEFSNKCDENIQEFKFEAVRLLEARNRRIMGIFAQSPENM